MTARRLPLVAAYERDHTYCTYCPKLCRSACPVATVSGRETTTPWAMMSTLDHVVHDRLPLTEPHGSSFYACTGCMRCRTECAHGNDVTNALLGARAEAMRADAAPDAARDIVARHEARVARVRDRARELFTENDETARVVYVPGCSAVATSPDRARRGHAVVAALTRRTVRVVADVCCGAPLRDAGDVAGSKRAREAFARRMESADLVVAEDPGCLAVLGETFAGRGPELRHAVELVSSAPLPRIDVGPVRYHDPCRLGRGLGIYEAPRRALAAMTGRAPLEGLYSRERSQCSGQGGQLPRTDPESAEAIANERVNEHRAQSPALLVTACPSAARGFERSGELVATVTDLVARSLGLDR